MSDKVLVTKQTKKEGFQKLLALAALIILFVFFSIFGKNFLTGRNIINILELAYFIGFLALGVTFVIITGGIDLSIGTVMMCATLIGGVAFSVWGWGLPYALALIVIVGTVFGLLNGFLVAKLRLPPFIATLGTMMISQGFGSIVSNVQTMRFPTVADETYGWFKQVFLRASDMVPTGVYFLIAIAIIAFFLLNKTRFGKYTCAIGSNEEAARLSGVNTVKWKMLVYTVCGLFSGFAGIFYAATYTTVMPGTGNGIELQAISAVVIGGTSLSGGSGSITGTIIGVFIMAVLKNGLMSIGLQQQYQTFFQGVVVILAVLLDVYRTQKASKA